MTPELYDRFERTQLDLDDWCRLGERATTAVLELGCGTGRVTGALRASGVRVIGLDSSLEMLQATSGKLPGVDLVLSDMRSFEIANRFDLIVAPARVLEMVDKRGAVETFVRCAAHLTPDGCLALQISHPPDDAQPVLSATAVDGRGTIWQEHLDRNRQLRTVMVQLREEPKATIGPMKLWWHSTEAWERLLAAAGLRVVDSWRGVGGEAMFRDAAIYPVLAVRE